MKVVHCKRSRCTHYIGRPSIFGNPFVVGIDGCRENCIRQFEAYARESKIIMQAILKLPSTAILGCWCRPKRCHGDAIIKIWKEMHKK